MNLFDKLKNNYVIPPFLEKKGDFVVEDLIGISFLVATSFKEKPDNYLVVAPNLFKAQKIYNFLTYFIEKENLLFFPADELIRAENIAQSKEMVAERIYVLNELKKEHKKIVVTNVAAVTRFLPNPKTFDKAVFNFKIGQTHNLSDIKKQLIKSGYVNVNKIDSSLQFAVRGDILDIYSVNNEYPVRIEFFGDEIESIRFFELSTQTSVKKVEEVTILPGSDVIFDDKEIIDGINKIKAKLVQSSQYLNQNTKEKLEMNVEEDLQNILEGNHTPRTYKYYSLINEDYYSLKDYCKDFTKVFVSIDQIYSSNDLLLKESFEYLDELFETGIFLNGVEMYQDIRNIYPRHGNKIICTKDLIENPDDVRFAVKSVPLVASKKNDAINIIQNYLSMSYDVLIAINSKEQLFFIEEILNELGITYEITNNLDISSKSHISICVQSIPMGAVFNDEKIVLLTSRELFNSKIQTARFSNKFKEASIIKSYEDLVPGDYVVHEYQGIGQFIEITNIETNGIHQDFLKIAYQGDSILYVPLTQFQLVRKYMGKEGYKPRLSRLHSKDWENTKKKIKEKINDLANRLMNLYIERNKVVGFAFQKDDSFQEDFENGFAYELTADQKKSLKEIKDDMESNRPMDRLLCGDVGFGKTEIAFRSAFKAILSGKQVAILCPTTLLARQHYELALERFTSYDVRIGLLSRLVPLSKQKEYIEGAASGKIHLLIGTHKLLSKNVSFKDLGLLIIDEEQRFGVEQKEKIKELKNSVDVLTLSATPIPRTLQISLLGVRALSQINTAPTSRMPIQTYVTPFKFEVVKELIERELGRNGQVFFLHNEISSIYMLANKLQRLVPDAVIGVAHGKMEKNEIEDVMMKFYNGEINLLVCTSIIENGIDVPNANMIIVEDAHKYGLSQLYQIKGRVGRSDRIAYAYLMYPEFKELTDPAKKRLKALQEFTELGSGYKIAQRDLMIRGAGDILGPEQAGFIDSIGLDMYIKLLNESVQDKLNNVIKEEDLVHINLNLDIDAYIPSTYANDGDKIALYQEIISCETIEQILTVKQKMIDIYGKMPYEVELLFEKQTIEVLTKLANIKSTFIRGNSIELVLDDSFTKIKGIGNILFETLIPFIQYTKIAYRDHLFRLTITKRKTWIKDFKNILESLLRIIQTTDSYSNFQVESRK